MNKKVRGFTALILALTLVFSIQLSSFAVLSLTKDDYLEQYNNYKSFYTNVYVPAYNAYNASLTQFAQDVADANITTNEQIESIRSFVNHLKNTKQSFFGDRTTVGKSRYDVPDYRESMFAAAASEDYSQACYYCSELLSAVEQRVNFLNSLKDEITEFSEVDLPNLILEESCSNVYDYVLTCYQNFDVNHLFKKSDDSGTGDPALQTYLSRYIEVSMEQAGYGKNTLGLRNPFSGKEGVLNWDNYRLTGVYSKQALVMSDHQDIKYSNSLSSSNGVNYLQGSIVIYLKNGYNKIEIYYVDANGSKSETCYSINVG